MSFSHPLEIFPLPLIQVGQLSVTMVTGESMNTLSTEVSSTMRELAKRSLIGTYLYS